VKEKTAGVAPLSFLPSFFTVQKITCTAGLSSKRYFFIRQIQQKALEKCRFKHYSI
jgi:hypothetical protein